MRRAILAWSVGAPILAMLYLATGGCAVTPQTRRSANTEPIPRMHSDDPLFSEPPSNMAADDADRFRAAPARKERSRRPPPIRQRRVVDQPLIRP